MRVLRGVQAISQYFAGPVCTLLAHGDCGTNSMIAGLSCVSARNCGAMNVSGFSFEGWRSLRIGA